MRAVAGLLLLAGVGVVVSVPLKPSSDKHELGEATAQKGKYEHVIAAAVKQVHEEGAAEDARKRSEALSHHRVANAVDHVWKTTDLNAMYNKEMNGKHWHCTHCHQSCKTIKCRAWCHETFCNANYEKLLGQKKGVGRVDIAPGEPVIPEYAASVKRANKALWQAEHATSDEDFRKANEDLADTMDKQQEDLKHYDQQQEYADAMDAAAYPDEEEQKDNDESLWHHEKEELNFFQAIQQLAKMATEKQTSADQSYMRSEEAKNEADEAMGVGGDNLLKDVQGDLSAEDATLHSDASSGYGYGHSVGYGSHAPVMTDVSNVAAEVERAGVKINAAAQEAGNADQKASAQQ